MDKDFPEEVTPVVQPDPEMKICTDCGIPKRITEFYWRPSAGRYLSYCKKCNGIRSRLWQMRNRERFNQWHRDWSKRTKQYQRYRKGYNATPQRQKCIYAYAAMRHLIHDTHAERIFLEKVGWTRPQLMKRLKETLPPNTTMADYGKKLTLDHIKPLSAFDLTKPEEFKKAFALKNLRLCDRSENARKGRMSYKAYVLRYHQQQNGESNETGNTIQGK